MLNLQTKLIVLASCLAVMIPPRSDALLLGNFIGCNSFGCRISALESDVAQLKQQVARMASPLGTQGAQGMQDANNFRPNNLQPFNQNNLNPMQQNQQGQQGQQAQQGQLNQNGQQQNGQPQTKELVNFALDYPIGNSQNLRRSSGYMNSGQFVRA